jgi:hypothetical protein
MNRPYQKGETPRGYTPLPTSKASVIANTSTEDNDDGFDEPYEFKQVRSPDSHSRLKRLVDDHDKKSRSFDLLMGGPESDYV